MDQHLSTSTAGPSPSMEKNHSIFTPVVLIVNDCTKFADMVVCQLSAHNYSVQTLTRQEALQPLHLEQCVPDVAFVDCDANSADGLQVHRLIRNTCPNCVIILMCNELASASTASQHAQSGEVFDYILLDSLQDPNRVPLLAERAWASHRQPVSQEESRGMLVDGLAQLLNKNVDHFSRSRILVVEDDPICIELARYILEYANFVVDVAQTPEEATALMQKHQPDLVLMDIHLEYANGIQLIAALRKGSVCPDVPVIIVTSDIMRDTLSNAMDVDIQGYFLKPYDSQLLVEKVRAVLLESKKSPKRGATGLTPDSADAVEYVGQ